MADFAEETNESEEASTPAEAPPAEHTARAAELIAKAEELKAAATELFKAKEYKKALTRYAKIRSYTWLPNGEAAQYGGGKSATKDYSAADVATITLQRPPMNALNATVQDEIRQAAEVVSEDASIGAVIVYGGSEPAA